MSYASTLPSLSVLRRMAMLAALALPLAPLGAQTTPASGNTTPPTQAAATEGIGLILVASHEHAFSANTQNNGAGSSLAVDRFSLGAQYTTPAGGGELVSSGMYSFINYDFSGIAPFGNVNKLGASEYYKHEVSDNWGAFGYLAGSLTAQTSTNLSDGGQIAVAVGPSYQVNEDLSIAAGPMFYTRIEETATVIPMADVTWKFLPQWEMHAYAGISNGVTVTYDMFNNQQTVLYGTMEYNSRWIRLSPNAAGNQSVNESDTVLKFGVRQIFGGHYFVRAYVEGLLSREYQFHTNGHSSNSIDIDSTMGLGLELGVAL